MFSPNPGAGARMFTLFYTLHATHKTNLKETVAAVEGELLGTQGAGHSPVLPRKACTSLAAPVLSDSSEVRTLVWALLTILHTLQRWPPSLQKDGFRLWAVPLSLPT